MNKYHNYYFIKLSIEKLIEIPSYWIRRQFEHCKQWFRCNNFFLHFNP